MKRLIFIETHLGSGSYSLFDVLDSHARIQGTRHGVYNDALDIQTILSLDHKNRSNAAIHMDELFYNHSLGSRLIYGLAKHIFFIREPKHSLNEIVYRHKYEPHLALSYYCFRLRRLCAIARKCGGVLLTYEDLCRGDGLGLIETMLNLKSPLVWHPPVMDDVPSVVPLKIIDQAQDRYESYLYFLRNCGLSSVQGNFNVAPVDGSEPD